MITMSMPKILLPREHGAWAVLLVPIMVVAGVKQHVSLDLLLLVLSSVAVFVASSPLQTILRHVFVVRQEEQKIRAATFWALAYFLTAGFLTFPLIMKGYWLLLGFGMVALSIVAGTFTLTRGSQKTIASDLIAVAGLSLSSFTSSYIIEGRLDPTAIHLWILNFLFFGSSVFYVHMKIQAVSAKSDTFGLREKISIGKLNLAYHIVTMAIVLTMAFLNFTAKFAIIAFIPIVIHAVYGTFKLSTRVKFNNLGLLLLGHSFLFAVALSLAFSSQ